MVNVLKTKEITIRVRVPVWVSEEDVNKIIKRIIDELSSFVPRELTAEQAREIFEGEEVPEFYDVREKERRRIRWLYSILQQ